jgi:hypothetical protein
VDLGEVDFERRHRDEVVDVLAQLIGGVFGVAQLDLHRTDGGVPRPPLGLEQMAG